MRMNVLKSSRGFTIMEILVSLGITAIATLSLFTVLQMYNTATSRSNTRSSIMDTELDAYFIQENLAEWITNVIDSTKPTHYIPEISNCFKTSGAVCPSALSPSSLSAIRDNELQSYISLGKIIATVPIKNLQGDIIAGTLTEPLYFNASGQKIKNRAQAVYSVVGVMVRDNTAGNPGKVVLLMRAAAENSRTNQGQTPLRTRWIRVNVGTRWELISSEIFGACNAGEFVVAVDKSTGSIQCQSIEQKCNTNQYATGFKVDGTIECSDLPPTVTPRPYTPPAKVDCDSFGFSTVNCTIPGGKTISSVTVSNRRSRSGCSIGSDVTWSGSTISVRGGCRATFNVYYD